MLTFYADATATLYTLEQTGSQIRLQVEELREARLAVFHVSPPEVIKLLAASNARPMPTIR